MAISAAATLPAGFQPAAGSSPICGAATNTTATTHASSTFGTGRVVIVGDSSPADDGAGSPGNTVYDGWNENLSHARLHLNASLWLAKLQ
ncbi:hypothetical protein [Hymenobacter sp. BT190]|uniref:hypothetical protein n=1 Tax=Hymenobacter sp. BT190 TaxID=2763505 RepID=UPI0016516076|nr:hypothetical protein [Hymenobacter sp. BT190]MBC6700029.1 hypothetical protein [Hymenobacter sp. BT190]